MESVKWQILIQFFLIVSSVKFGGVNEAEKVSKMCFHYFFSILLIFSPPTYVNWPSKAMGKNINNSLREFLPPRLIFDLRDVLIQIGSISMFTIRNLIKRNWTRAQE